MRFPALIAFIAFTLGSLSIGCNQTDTKPRKEWDGEPRLSVPIDERLGESGPCGPIRTERQTVSIAIGQSVCAGIGLEALKNFADGDPVAMSDLSAVYYIRARRENRPAEFLMAFDAASHAAATTAPTAAAKFNLALSEEALGLTTEAARHWQELGRGDAGVQRHEEELRQRLDAQWSPGALRTALHARLRKEVAGIVREHPLSSLRFMEDELLPGDMARAYLLAEEWTAVTGDHYALDEVNAVASALPAKSDELKSGYAALRDSRIGIYPGIDKGFALASTQLQDAGSPAALYAQGGSCFARRDLGGIEAVRKEAHLRSYGHVEAWLLSAAGYTLFDGNKLLDALASYEAAQSLYEQLHDLEGVSAVKARRAGLLRVLGQFEDGWREALDACRHRSRLGMFRDEQLLLGETAALALSLGHPEAALFYADEAIRSVQKALASTPPERTAMINFLQYNVASVRRKHAGYELRAGHPDLALKDLTEAQRLSKQDPTSEYRAALEARIAEVEGDAALRVDPKRAIAAFTRAIEVSKPLEYSSFIASLYVKRAEAKRRNGTREEAELDLRSALALLDNEESKLLQERLPQQADEIVWSSYFARFQQTYQDLIRQLVESGRGAEAFAYADRARAFEPLNLALKLAPAAHAAPIDMAGAQRSLPSGTFLLEYEVLADRTYAWVVSRESWQLLTLSATQADVQRWSDALVRSVPSLDFDTLDATMLAAYDKLLTEPMSAIARMPGGSAPRLVFVPDGAMHGLPFCALRSPISRRYLIEDAPVATAGSAALYAFSLRRDAALPREVSALLIGNPSTSGSNLPGAEAEVRRIAALYGARATVRTQAAATTDEFLAGTRTNAIVHIAAHSRIDPQTPSRSFISLAGSAGNSGSMDAAQLLTRLEPRRTRLIVLASCSSAGGMPVGAQGIGPLVRPLIVKGVPAVVGTLWDVNDATAEPLLVSFHQHYREGDDAAAAMQKAQIELLRNGNSGLQSVLAWAPFEVIGYGSSPFAAPR